VVLIKKGCEKPSVKILKTPDNSFLALKRIAGVNIFSRFLYLLTPDIEKPGSIRTGETLNQLIAEP
jgi:hypothetical protein